jgi:hypothetical protein
MGGASGCRLCCWSIDARRLRLARNELLDGGRRVAGDGRVATGVCSRWGARDVTVWTLDAACFELPDSADSVQGACLQQPSRYRYIYIFNIYYTVQALNSLNPVPAVRNCEINGPLFVSGCKQRFTCNCHRPYTCERWIQVFIQSQSTFACFHQGADVVYKRIQMIAVGAPTVPILNGNRSTT